MATTTLAGGAPGARAGRRLWARREQAIWPFFWRGALPLVGLLLLGAFALLPFARGDIETAVRDQVRDQLERHALGWVAVSVSGQDVHLGGIEIQAGDGERALQAARDAVCPTWAGPLTCAVQVDGAFTQPAPAAPAPPSAAQSCEAQLAGIVAQSQIEFANASAAISPASARVLDALAKAAAQCPGVLRIEGHTDSVGPAAANQLLSDARAAAVRAALIQRGLAAAQLRAEGLGARVPLADNATEAGRARNRRIEFHVDAPASAP